MMNKKTKEFVILVVGILIIISVFTIDYFRSNEIELSKQKAMRESWAEGYDQGYSDAYFKLTGDEPRTI